MKNLIFGIFKITVALIVAVLIMGGIYYLVSVVYGQPAYVSFCVMALVMGLTILGYFILHYLRRLRQKKFVENIVAQDDLLLQKTKNEEYVRLAELRERWLRAIDTIKSSSLSKRGNPLYVLPWYLIIGESGSGKSSSIARSGLTSISSEVGPVPGIASTRNCDWWFFDRAIVIDTAGKYTVPVDGNIDEIEWKEFLIQVATYRKKEPLNGIVVTLPMEKLLGDNSGEIEKYASFVSDKVNRIVRVLSARIPVYVMITKTDLLTGFSSLIKSLSAEERDQAFGYTSSTTDNHLAIVDRTFDFTAEALLKLTMSSDGPNIDSEGVMGDKTGILLFLENIRLLKDPVRRFIQTAFDNTTYHENVLLRGIYFSSALQTGNNSTLFAADIIGSGDEAEKKESSKNSGYFLNNFFRDVLPAGRGLFQPIAEFLRWKTITSNLALVSLSVLTLGFMGYFCYSAQYSETRSEELGHALEQVDSNKFINESRINAMVNLLNIIDDIEDDLSYSLQFNFTRQSLASGIHAVKRYLVYEYEKYNMHELLSLSYWDRRINEGFDPKMDRLESDVKSRQAEALGDAVLFFSIMDRYYQQMLKYNNSSQAEEVFDNLRYINADNLMCRHFNYDNCIRLFKRYISYRDEISKNVYLLEDAHSNLEAILYKYKDFGWVENWANEKAPEVRAGSFMPLSFYPNRDYDFGGAFSKKGYEYIGALLKLLPDVHSKINMPMKKQVFMDYYASNFKSKWIRFLSNIQKTSDDAHIQERMSIVPILSDPERNPFFLVYNRAYQELSFISKFTDVDISHMLLEQLAAVSFNVKEKTSELSKLAGKVGISPDKISKITDPSKISPELQNKMEDVAKMMTDYFAGLENASAMYASENEAYRMIKSMVSATSDDNVISNLRVASAGLRKYLDGGKTGTGGKTSVSGTLPFDSTNHFLQHLSLDMAACVIQKKWMDRVVTKVSDDNVDLFGEKGLVTEFLDGELNSLITEGIGGYESVDIYGMKIPFEPTFITFLNGRKAISAISGIKEVKVKMSTTPMEVNDEALILPQSSLVTIHCKDKDYKLGNFNYANDMTFLWKKNECNSVSLDITFEGFDLHTEYDGPYGLADFFQLFMHSDSHTFTAFDFPGQDDLFDAVNLQWIRLSYKIRGGEDVVRSINEPRLVKGVPHNATSCR